MEWTPAERGVILALVGVPYYYGGGPGRTYAAGPVAGQSWDDLHGDWAASLLLRSDEHAPVAPFGAVGGLDCGGLVGLVARLTARVRGDKPPTWTRPALNTGGLRATLAARPLDQSREGDVYLYNSGTHVTFALGRGYTLGANGGGPTTFGTDKTAKVSLQRWYWSSALCGALDGGRDV